MCKILFSARTVTHADPAKDRCAWKPGYAATVFEDSHVWGREENRNVWNTEVRHIPCIAAAGSSEATVTTKTGSVEVRRSMINRLHGSQRCVQQELDYVVEVDGFPYFVHVSDDDTETWTIPIEGTVVPAKLPPRQYHAFGIFQKARLLFDAPFTADTQELLIRNDPALWHGRTVCVNLNGVPAAKAAPLCDEEHNDDSDTPTGEMYRRRRWRLRVADLPAGVKNQLQTVGEVTVTPTQVRNYLRRVRDDAQYTGLD